MSKKIVLSAKIDYLINYAKQEYSKSKGLHLNSADWGSFVTMGTPQYYSFIINGTIKFYTKSKISAERYDQLLKLVDFKKLEAPLLLLFLIGHDDKTITEFISLLLSHGEAKLFCPCEAFCLEENTLIDLVDGRILTIKELCEEYNDGKINYVYSIDSNNNPTVNKINKVWKSGKSKNLIRITLDNGKNIVTTPEHYYIMRDGSNVMAKDLNINDSLMPIYIIEDKKQYKYFKMNGEKYSYKKKSIHKITNIEHLDLDTDVDVYDMEVENDHNFYVNAGIVLHNSYWGPHYNLTKIKSAYGPGEIRPPDKRDPNRQNLVCKHLWVVLDSYSKLVNSFTVGLLPYYKRLFGLTSPAGIERLQKTLGQAGFKKVIEQAVIDLNKINNADLINKFKQLTDGKLNEIMKPKETVEPIPEFETIDKSKPEEKIEQPEKSKESIKKEPEKPMVKPPVEVENKDITPNDMEKMIDETEEEDKKNEELL